MQGGCGSAPQFCGITPYAVQFGPTGPPLAGMVPRDGVSPAIASAPVATAALCPADAVQRIGERFTQLYYGLLAVRPSALHQFYREESQMSRSWCSAGAARCEAPNTSMVNKGVAQIMEAIMVSVGGHDPADSGPVVVTKVEHVQSSMLPDESGIMSHITGFITFLQEGKMCRFSQSVLLEPGPTAHNLLFVRNDIVHYLDSLAPLGPLSQQQGLILVERTGLFSRSQRACPSRQVGVESGVVEVATSGSAVLPAQSPEAPEVLTRAQAATSAAPTSFSEDLSSSGTAVQATIAVPGEVFALAGTAAAQAGALPAASTVSHVAGIETTCSVAVPLGTAKAGGGTTWAEIAGSHWGAKGSHGVGGGGHGPGTAMKRPSAAAATFPKSLQALLSPAPPAAVFPSLATSGGGGMTMNKNVPVCEPTLDPVETPIGSLAAMAITPSLGSGSGTATASTAGGAHPSGVAGERALVKLWVSQIPTEETRGRDRDSRFNPVRGPEVREALNQCLREHAPQITGEVIEVDRKDERKPFAFAQLSDERTAKELVMLSKQRKVQLRGERLILDLSNYNTTRVDTLYTGVMPTGKPQWHDERGDRGVRGKGGKGETGWAPRERGGRGWRGCNARPISPPDNHPHPILGPSV